MGIYCDTIYNIKKKGVFYFMNELKVRDIDYQVKYIAYAGFLKEGDNYSNDSGYKFIYVKDGKCMVYTGKEKCLLSVGNMMVVKPECNLRIKKLCDNAKCIIIEFYSETDWEYPLFFENVSELNKNLMEKMIKEYNDREYAYEIHLESLFYEIVGRLVRTYYFDKLYTGDYRKLHDSILYLKENFLNKDMRMEEVAEASGLSLSYFRKLFVKVYKISPRSYVSELRLHKADELLKYTTMNIAEISETLKFENQYYFSNFYKKHKGISPQKYRNRQVNNNEQ